MTAQHKKSCTKFCKGIDGPIASGGAFDYLTRFFTDDRRFDGLGPLQRISHHLEGLGTMLNRVVEIDPENLAEPHRAQHRAG